MKGSDTPVNIVSFLRHKKDILKYIKRRNILFMMLMAISNTMLDFIFIFIHSLI